MRKITIERNEDGFTLVEILVVIGIIAVLAAIAIPVYLNQKQVAINATLQSDLKQMVNTQMDYIANGHSVWGTPMAIRPEGDLNPNGSHNTSFISFNPSPGNYIRTPVVINENNKAVGICIIVWNPNSKKYPNEGNGLAWNSINDYGVTPNNCSIV